MSAVTGLTKPTPSQNATVHAAAAQGPPIQFLTVSALVLILAAVAIMLIGGVRDFISGIDLDAIALEFATRCR